MRVLHHKRSPKGVLAVRGTPTVAVVVLLTSGVGVLAVRDLISRASLVFLGLERCKQVRNHKVTSI